MDQEDQEERITAQELRQVAEYVEDTILETLANYSDISFPLVHGDLKTSPRASAESRAAQKGFDILRQNTEEAVTTLHALAAAMDNDLDVPQVLLLPFRPYIEAFRSEPEAEAAESAL
jgi:hypothetical protein